MTDLTKNKLKEQTNKVKENKQFIRAHKATSEYLACAKKYSKENYKNKNCLIVLALALALLVCAYHCLFATTVSYQYVNGGFMKEVRVGGSLSERFWCSYKSHSEDRSTAEYSCDLKIEELQ